VATRGLLAAFLVGLAILAYIVFQSAAASQQNRAAAPGQPAKLTCSPAPCANLQGYQVWITGFQAQARSVTLDVSFQNSSSSTHADPSDFALLDASGLPFRPTYDSTDCPHWPRTEFSNGERRGPFHLCFKPSSSAPPLKLRWTPDMGLFCCRAEIVLTP
jgi:hypothetical protein